MASVTLKNVYKIYAGGVTAVTDFCLDIEDKRVYHSRRTFRLRQVHDAENDRGS